ncbi:MAG TPA: hypothetical protein VI855_07605 [Dehalococcoidia bacterium]|nr:hypothetical protein [Dehalococcoidia bacterium]
MPGKGRRIAVRQAELRSRRRRPGQAAGASPAGRVAVEDRAPAAPAPQSQQPAAAAPVSASPARPSASAQRTSGGRPRSRADQPLAYSYVGTEMRRILIVSGAVLAILVALTFVLPNVI